jgi:hypothetical protein
MAIDAMPITRPPARVVALGLLTTLLASCRDAHFHGTLDEFKKVKGQFCASDAPCPSGWSCVPEATCDPETGGCNADAGGVFEVSGCAWLCRDANDCGGKATGLLCGPRAFGDENLLMCFVDTSGPNIAEGRIRAGLKMLAAENWSEAENRFRDALSRDPGNERAKKYLSLAERHQHAPDAGAQ